LHRLVPIHKRNSRHVCNNYRGIHVTDILSKCTERLLAAHFMPHLRRVEAFGDHQFAFLEKRGCKDALVFFVCNWLRSLAAGKVVALYCADVEGAFDRVDAGRLVSKLANFGISGPLLDVMRDWLSVRHGCVALE
jgi:hypothetical protein